MWIISDFSSNPKTYFQSKYGVGPVVTVLNKKEAKTFNSKKQADIVCFHLNRGKRKWKPQEITV